MPLTTAEPPAADSSAPTDTQGNTPSPAPADSATATEPHPDDEIIADALAGMEDVSTDDVTTTATEPEPAEVETDSTAEPAADDAEDAEPDKDEEENEETTEDDDDDAEADADADDDDETDSEESDQDEEDDDDDAELPESVQKRFDKLTAQKVRYRDERDEAKERITALEEEVAEAQRNSVTLNPTAANPLADLNTDEAIADRRKNAQSVFDWASNPDHRDGATVGDTYFSAEEVADKRRAAEMELQLHIPKRQEWVQANRTHNREAREVYPFLFEKGHAGDVANDILARGPGIMEMPDYELIVGDALIGRAARQGIYKLVPVNKPDAAAPSRKSPKSKSKTAATAKAKAKSEPELTSPPASPSKTAPPRSATAPAGAAAERRLAESGGSDADALTDLAGSLLDD